MSESRIQNHESGHPQGSNPEYPELYKAWSSPDLGISRGDWSDLSLMTYDSGFWILLVQWLPQAESWAVLKAAVGLEQSSTSCMRIWQALQTSTDKSLSTHGLRRIMTYDSTSLHLPSEFKASFSSCLSLDCDKQMEQNPKPQECENWECKISSIFCN